MRKHTFADIEARVQFWVDLIQVRAPGSSIVVCGTHMDEYSEPERQRLMDALRHQLEQNELLRCEDIQFELRQMQENVPMDSNSVLYKQFVRKQELLKKALSRRPKFCDCVPVAVETEFDGSVRSGYDISRLIAAIQKVSTASREDKNPFQLVDVYHPMYYSHVKAAAEELKHQFKLMTLMDLHEAAVKRAGPAAQNSGITPKDTAGAVAYLTCIGEVRVSYSAAMIIDRPTTL